MERQERLERREERITKKIISTPIFAYFYLFVAFSCFGQNGQPTPSPNPSDDEVVKISTTLIQVDVTVTDKNGKTITDLKQGDFEIFENEEIQEITNFSFVSADALTSSTKNTEGIPLSISPIKREQVRRTIALVVDDLSLTFENIYSVRKSLRRFVDEQMRDGDFVAIARTDGGNGVLEQFTSDRRQLYAAIEKIKVNPLGRGVPEIKLPPIQSISTDTTGLIDTVKEERNFRQSVIATRTIGGLNYIVSGMKNLPGRKSVIIFSEGFKIFNTATVGKELDSRLRASLEKLFDSAARASVVVDTVDARGLLPAPDEDFFDQQDGLSYLAKQTGGISIKDNNDFNLGIEKILSIQKGYYLIGYAPAAETFDQSKSRFNKFTVKVKREGAAARYRSGFFGVNNEENEKPTNRNSSERLRAALTSPFAVNEIALNLNTLFGSDAKEASFVRSLLHINAGDLKFTDEADGGKKASFDVLAISFNDSGAAVDKIVKNYVLTLPAKEYQKILAEGFVYFFTFPVNKPGAYQFRVAIRDKQSEKIGSASQFVEIPNLKKDGLVLSGVVLESLTRDQWQRETRTAQNEFSAEKIKNQSESNLLVDTALKRFRRDRILRYGFEIYNPKLDAARKPQLTAQIKMFRDGKLVLEGKPLPVDLTEQTDWQKVTAFGAIDLASKMPPGDYILQIIVTDNLLKGKGKIAAQVVQFEIVE